MNRHEIGNNVQARPQQDSLMCERDDRKFVRTITNVGN